MSVTFNDDEFNELMAALENAIAAAGAVATVARRVGVVGYKSATRDELARLLAGITPAPGPGPAATAEDLQRRIAESDADYGRGWATNKPTVDDATDAAELPPLKVTAAATWVAGNALREMIQGQAIKMGQGRAPSAGTRQLVYLTLKHTAGNDDALHGFIDFVFRASSYKDLSAGSIWALQAWLKPAGLVDGKYAAANADAAAQVATVLAAHALESPAADPVPANA